MSDAKEGVAQGSIEIKEEMHSVINKFDKDYSV
jgi:hypothetical protein